MVTYPYYPSFGGRTIDIWRMLKKSGSITSIPTGDWTPDITASISSSSDLLSYSRNTGCYTAQGVIGGTYTGFANYQMARDKVGVGTALPIELISLTSENMDNKLIRLLWATAQEINNKGFMVMRSTNGSDFAPIGWVDAQGNGNKSSRSDYTYDDETAIPGVLYYYYLAQQDQDGVISNTYIVEGNLNMNGNLSISDCYPNPTNGNSNIMIHSTADLSFKMEIYNMAGQLIQRNDMSITAGETTVNINSNKLPTGLYDIVLRTNENVFTNKLNIIK